MVSEGKTHQEIADIIGISRRTVGNWCKRYDIKTKRQLLMKRKKRIQKEVVDRYNKGESSTVLGKEYEISRGTVVDWVRAMGFEPRDSSTSKMKYEINSEYFDEINSHNKAYLLGFILADGYI